MKAEKGVVFYKTGIASIAVHFPNGDAVCRWCPFVRHDESLRRHRCLFTGEYLPFPLDTLGNECPISFEQEGESRYGFDLRKAEHGPEGRDLRP